MTRAGAAKSGWSLFHPIPVFRVEFSAPSATCYAPGSHVRGRVVALVRRPVSISAVVVSLRGEVLTKVRVCSLARVQARQHACRPTPPRGLTPAQLSGAVASKVECDTASGYEQLFCDSQCVYGDQSAGARVRLERGSHRWDFDIPIPAQSRSGRPLPPTHASDHAWVRYHLSASTDGLRALFGRDVECCVPVTVAPIMDVSNDDFALPSVTEACSRARGCPARCRARVDSHSVPACAPGPH